MYYLVYGLLYIFSLIPLALLYLVSDFAYLIIYYVIKYRRDVVMSNLTIVFPEKTEGEKIKIAKDFYHNFCDTFIEAIKMISTSSASAQKRVEIDTSVLKQLYETGQNVQLHAMHNFNWEVVNLGVGTRMIYPFLGVTMKIGNANFDRIFTNLRQKGGTIVIPATEFKTKFHKYSSDRFALALVADQTPGSPSNAYWLSFFGKPTPFVTGPEKGARLNNCAVFFGNFYKVKRGHYKVELHLQTTDPNSLKEGELTIRFARFVEECIRQRPANYLWSHKRWKWPYKEEYAELVVDN
jgi:Kdo2-lipid IVA lauroyltransferase/acyltransferase